MYKLHTSCRVCGSQNLSQYLDLGMMPMSNNLCESQSDEAPRFPLKVLLCENCSLSQLSVVIDPKVLFGHYVYRSSISKGYRDHCHNMAVELKGKYGLNEDSFHIDIAGNDGALLNEFKQVVNSKMLNIDPAENLVAINEAQGIRMYNTFWGVHAASHLIETHWPAADLITATNVFAHVDDVKEFIFAAKGVLKFTGVLVLEFPYLVDFIEKKEFDTVYFEHLSYFSITPLWKLVHDCGLNIMDVQKFDIHGGSVRVTIGYGEPKQSVYTYMDNEYIDRMYKLDTYQRWAGDVRDIIRKFRASIMELKRNGKMIAGFAASAKGNTLLNSAGISDSMITYIIDETPEKVGKYSPGTHIPIVPLSMMQSRPPDYIVLLAWNFADECIRKCRDAGYNGKFIYPLTFEVI